jgi:histone deacetylase 11
MRRAKPNPSMETPRAHALGHPGDGRYAPIYSLTILDAGLLALIKGWSVNLGGGFHHASYHDGQGFCVYADITLCVHHLRTFHGDRVKKVMIIDVDAHQANGIEKDFVDDPEVYIVDVYNPDLYPFDYQARKAIALDIQITSDDTDMTYLKKLDDNIPYAIDVFSPNFIIYVAGCDVLMGDPLGGLDFEAETIIKRDAMIFEWAFTRDIPITMLLGGKFLGNL